MPVTGTASRNDSKAWLELRYDHNLINDLISDNQLLKDDYLSRNTRAVIAQVSYSPMKRFFLHAIVRSASYRKI